jgi:16S rRNA (cytosine967-C5)-methyltransferase
VAADVRASRTRLITANVARLGLGNVAVVQADGRRPPFLPNRFDRVLVDAPCTGLGVLRRRPDARWRISPDDLDDLVRLQRDLVVASLRLVASGGTFVYSVCTLTQSESTSMDEWLAASHPELEVVRPPETPWTSIGRGARLLPQDAGTDGMYLLALRAPG